ncbi:MAG: polysaccharide biosynthesis protein [Ruminococcus sp.]|nr:polysaccharide biosynthesis protein [Ruminococcus sp.]
MRIKSRIIRDTLLLTAMQLFLDTASLFLNSFIAKRLGAEATGILTLTGSFIGFAGIISNGNAYLCTSRLISEELGKKEGSPEKVLVYGIKLCLMLSLGVSAFIILFSDKICKSFFSGADMADMIRAMPIALIAGAVSSCFKGYFNAVRKPAINVAGDIGEFVIRSGVIVLSALEQNSHTEHMICEIMMRGIITGNIFLLLFLGSAYIMSKKKKRNKCSINFRKYITTAFPIMGGGILTAALSSTNDALIPICLRQNGNTVSQALSDFGIFEAIVIPALFFPSVILCSISGIIVSESARASASGNRKRIVELTERITKYTLIFAIFISAVLIRFGHYIGEMLGGGALAGTIITQTAPIIPFIYMEIVLEALIKGTGQQAFSSLNYFAEYAVRISAVLIFVPMIGFNGIVISYYSSNIIGNTSRFIRLARTTGMKPRLFGNIIIPAVYSFLTMNFWEVFIHIRDDKNYFVQIICFVALWGMSYLLMLGLLGKIKAKSIKRPLSFVHN